MLTGLSDHSVSVSSHRTDLEQIFPVSDVTLCLFLPLKDQLKCRKLAEFSYFPGTGGGGGGGGVQRRGRTVSLSSKHRLADLKSCIQNDSLKSTSTVAQNAL